MLILRAEFGALVEQGTYPYGKIKVQMRTGNPEFDNTHFVGRDFWNYGPATGGTTFESDGNPVQFDFWALTDYAYKTSLERLSAKRAYRQTKMIKEIFPDLSAAPISELLKAAPLPAEADFNEALWSERMRRLSSIFRMYPKVQTSNATFEWGRQRTYFFNSEGTRVRRPSPWVVLSINGETQARDGMSLQEERSFVAFSPDGLPSDDALNQEARALGTDLTGLVETSTGTFYVGPVIFEGQAASEFFNQLLADNVSFPKEVWTENEGDKKYFEKGALVDRVGTRVTSILLDVTDDPTLETYDGIPLFGHYGIDDEGVTAEKISLVERGMLKDIPMSRAPVKGHPRSNGHGRAGFHEFVSGRISNLLIQPRKAVKASQLKEELLRLCREQELDYGLVVRRMATEERREQDHLLSSPVMVYKVYVKDGREEPVRGLEFNGVTLRALRDIIAASEERTVYNLYQLGGLQRNRGDVPASIVAPSILVQEMELKPADKKPSRLPYLPHPYFEGKK